MFDQIRHVRPTWNEWDGTRQHEGVFRLMSIVAALALVAVLVAACGEEDPTPGSSGTGPTATATVDETPTPDASPTTPASPGATPDSTDEPIGRDDLVLSIEVTGGLAMPHAAVTELPWLAVYNDGSFITQGPVIAIYPGPALPNLLESRLTPEGIRLLIEAARDAGLTDGDAQYTSSMVADAQTTIFTMTVDGETSRVEVYGLEFEELPPDTSPEEIEARKALREFRNQVSWIGGLIPESEFSAIEQPYVIERMQLVTQPVTVAEVPSDPGIVPNEMAWPLDTPLAEFGEPYRLMESRCGVVEGEELVVVLDAMQQANQLTQWSDGSATYVVYPRPLLPHEDGCTVEVR